MNVSLPDVHRIFVLKVLDIAYVPPFFKFWLKTCWLQLFDNIVFIFDNILFDVIFGLVSVVDLIMFFVLNWLPPSFLFQYWMLFGLCRPLPC